MRYVTTFLAALALIAIVIFSIQNLGVVKVSFLTWSVEISKCVIFIATYVLGMVSGWGLVDLFKRGLQAEPQ